jgi:signal transduction histidine kinase
MAEPSGRRGPSIAIVVVLALVVVIDVAAVTTALRARREAVAAAVLEVERRLEIQARTLESALARARADLEVLAAAEVFAAKPPSSPEGQRALRLQRDSALLLFAAGHPVLDEVRFDGEGPGSRVVRAGAEPFVLSPRAAWPRAPLEAVTLAPAGRLSMWSGGDALAVVFGDDRATILAPAKGPLAAAGDQLVARERLDLGGWSGAAELELERREPRRELMTRIEALATSSRWTLLLHLALVPLTIGLGLLALRSERQNARLAAAREVEEQQRALERQVWHAERLASVGRLASGLAHEINNPLAGMTTWLDLLEEDLEAGAGERARSTGAKLRIGLERIRDIVSSTLAFADPGRGEATDVDLRAVVDDTASFVGTLMPQVTIEPALGTDPILVRGDRPALGQLVLNLLVNAAEVQQRSGWIRVELSTSSTLAYLLVEDDGPGIAEEVLATMFEPFVSGRGSTGLGLSVCFGIVAAHGGTIHGENRGERGARFVVELPRRIEGEET